MTVLDTMKHERADMVLLAMSPFDQQKRDYTTSVEIDRSMYNRFVGKNLFKVGQTERVVYEKVAGMKRVNVL